MHEVAYPSKCRNQTAKCIIVRESTFPGSSRGLCFSIEVFAGGSGLNTFSDKIKIYLCNAMLIQFVKNLHIFHHPNYIQIKKIFSLLFNSLIAFSPPDMIKLTSPAGNERNVKITSILFHTFHILAATVSSEFISLNTPFQHCLTQIEMQMSLYKRKEQSREGVKFLFIKYIFKRKKRSARNCQANCIKFYISPRLCRLSVMSFGKVEKIKGFTADHFAEHLFHYLLCYEN